MTEEEKKAIEYIKSELQDEKEAREDYQSLTGLYGNLEIETILNLIQKQDTEINKLNNVIDRMAEQLWILDDTNEEDCFIPREYSDINDCVKKKSCKDCIKDYFIKENQ